ncbi:tRNA(Met) cytidine acetyltransferase TmcA [Pseudoalteromonas holothuriae]|uniref:tRNA(Met) cytidine acetyltransferase TmcA n=1 Tax=Pseudoalteromonas holothuriae TaxID=2963714 RepID=A0ABM9GKA6_9GAMM|nr:GNAT family N-acetyltransferase [Pseudoalteromonas sp. CIP111951]CAH9062755.1 tRNA(Met) cytidine acetyltransferase TmcA [Pseudoalteromonas sp. CIP111951]
MPVYKASKLAPLLTELARNRHRQLLLLCGEHEWAIKQLNELFDLSDSDRLLLSKHPALEHACWLEHLHQILGQEFALAIYDGYSGIEPNKLAALSGTVKAGGLLILILPELSQLSNWLDPSAATWCSHGFSVNQSPFLQRWQKLLRQLNVSYLSQCDGLFLSLHGIKQQSQANYNEQKSIIEKIANNLTCKKPQPTLLSADRGRGKSASLGLLAAHLRGQNFIICALQYRAVKNSFKHLAQQLGLEYKGHEKQLANLHFMPPDQLLKLQIENQVLLIDEAAAIPVPVLIALAEKTKRCVFSSTIIGYEGNGRGYTLRFKQYLSDHHPDFICEHLQQPIRYQQNDPLEKQINHLFALDCQYPIARGSSNITFEQLKSQDLVQNEQLLHQAFSLLVLAHYQTTVNDLRQLLDSPSQVIFIVRNTEQVLGLCLVNIEGQISEDLHSEIATGTRRPQGHLLPQQLFSIQGNQHFLTAKIARIVRIAIAPQLHTQGLGTALLNYTHQQLGQSVDYFGSSFGATSRLLKFWQKNGYQTTKLGFKQDKASGEYAAIVLKNVTESNFYINKLCQHFRMNFCYQLSNHYQYLPWQLAKQILTAMPNLTLPKQVTEQLNFMVNKATMLEQDSATIWKVLITCPKLLLELSDVSQQLGIRLLLQNNTKEWLKSDLPLDSKKQFSHAFNTLVSEIHGQLNSLH